MDVTLASPADTTTKAATSSSESGTAPVRIAHVQLLPILSGVQKVSLDEFSLLNRQTFEPHLICQSTGAFPQAVTQWGVQNHTAPSLKRAIAPLADYRAYRELVALFRKIKPHIVHTHSSKTGLLGRMAAAKAKVPVIVHTVHGFAFPATRSRLKRMLFMGCERLGGRYCDGLVCLNSDDETIATRDLHVPSSRVFRVPNGVHLDQFQPITDPKTKQKVQEDKFGKGQGPVVLMVGRLWKQKNPCMFVEAACQLLDQGCQARFFLAGDGPLRKELEQKIQERGYQEQIRLLGWRSDIQELLPASDLFVLPSNWEGLPLVLLEAAACGVPVVATDIAGNRDALLNGETGLLCQKNNPDDLATNIKWLVEDEAMRESMVQKSYAHAVANYDIHHRHDAIMKLYADLLTQKGLQELATQIHHPPKKLEVKQPHHLRHPASSSDKVLPQALLNRS